MLMTNFPEGLDLFNRAPTPEETAEAEEMFKDLDPSIAKMLGWTQTGKSSGVSREAEQKS